MSILAILAALAAIGISVFLFSASTETRTTPGVLRPQSARGTGRTAVYAPRRYEALAPNMTGDLAAGIVGAALCTALFIAGDLIAGFSLTFAASDLITGNSLTQNLSIMTASVPFVGLPDEDQPENLMAAGKDLGGYSLKFLEHRIEATGLEHAEIVSVESEEAGRDALHGFNYSFAWLRDDGVRALRLFSGDSMLDWDETLEALGISVEASETSNGYSRFKAGKYLGRLMRPQKFAYSGHDIDVHVNENMVDKHGVPANDGLSIISPELAEKMGVDPEPGTTGQFTMVFGRGLVKGHYHVREAIDHDVVVYGEENIKTEVQLEDGPTFVSAEPIGETKRRVLLDVQTAFNLFSVFGGEQLLDWAEDGIQTAVAKLFNGEMNDVLSISGDEDIDPDKERGLWPLAAAIRRNIDYTSFPTLLKRAWRQYRQEINNYNGGAFRIPLPGACRAYVRTCRRHMDGDGNYEPDVSEGEIFVGRQGSFFIHPADAEHFHDVHGGSDEDDPFVFVPLEDGRTLAYRSPNQYGEVGVYDVNFAFDVDREAYLASEPEVRVAEDISDDSGYEHPETDDGDLDVFGKVEGALPCEDIGTYTATDLIKEWNELHSGRISIGVAANAGMVKSAIRTVNPELAAELDEEFSWNLEEIIDAANKNGITEAASNEMEKVFDFFEHLERENIAVPEVAQPRIPGSFEVPTTGDHPMDNLMGTISNHLKRADKRVNEVASAANPDHLLDALYGLVEQAGSVAQKARSIRVEYAKLIGEIDDDATDEERRQGIQSAQRYVVEEFARFGDEARLAFISVMAYDIYAGDANESHDSILWIADAYEKIERGDTTYRGDHICDGTSRYVIEVLQRAGKADELEVVEEDQNDVQEFLDVIFDQDTTSSHVEVTESDEEDEDLDPDVDYVRVWQSGGIPVDRINGVQVAGSKVKLHFFEGTYVVNLGDDSEIADGAYSVVDEFESGDTSMTLGLERVEC